MSEGKEFNISKKAFITSMTILLLLIVFVGIMTLIVPTGSYERTMIDGREMIVNDSFKYTEVEQLHIWRWFTAPIEVLWGADSLVIIVIIVFLLFIGGAVCILNESNVLYAIVGKIINRFKNKRYLLIAIICFVFMMFGAVMGIFEEVIPMIPIMISLAYCFGWDALVGLGMVVLASGFGFAAAISNPFTIGVAQEIAGLPMFSGAFFRIIIFLIIYVALVFFLTKYAKMIEKDPTKSLLYKEGMDRNRDSDGKQYEIYASMTHLGSAIRFFVGTIVLLIVLLIMGSVIEAISDYSLPIVGVLFLIGGFGSGLLSGMKLKKTFKVFISGSIRIAPGIVLLLMAASIKHIITEAGIMDTILYSTSNFIKDANPIIGVIIVYFLVLIMNFFIGSGSAKAFLIMPIVVPLADMIGVNRQIMVLGFQLGDGFSNVIYPTNPVLLISLGLAVVSYPKWLKWTLKIQLFIFIISLLLLEVALLIKYGPF